MIRYVGRVGVSNTQLLIGLYVRMEHSADETAAKNGAWTLQL